MENEQKKGKTWLKIIAAVFFAFVLYFTGYERGKSYAQLDVKTSVAPIQKDIAPTDQIDLQAIPEGMYAVGKDIPPGEYRIISDNKGTFVIYSSSDPTVKNNIIDSGVIYGQKYVTVQGNQFLEIKRSHMVKVN